MPRPSVDVDGAEYQKILYGRQMYRLYGARYKDMVWAEETLQKLERKLHHGDFYTDKDMVDFLRIKEIHGQVFGKRFFSADTPRMNIESPDGHITTHYVWHTRGDDKVRGTHAVNNGKVFAWDDPPPAKHPGEDWGCRCWAEPFAETLEESKSQIVTYFEDVF